MITKEMFKIFSDADDGTHFIMYDSNCRKTLCKKYTCQMGKTYILSNNKDYNGEISENGMPDDSFRYSWIITRLGGFPAEVKSICLARRLKSSDNLNTVKTLAFIDNTYDVTIIDDSIQEQVVFKDEYCCRKFAISMHIVPHNIRLSELFEIISNTGLFNGNHCSLNDMVRKGLQMHAFIPDETMLCINKSVTCIRTIGDCVCFKYRSKPMYLSKKEFNNKYLTKTKA